MVIEENKTGRVFFFTWVMVLVCVVILTGFNGLYGQDSHEYLRYCNRLHDFFTSGLPAGGFFWAINYSLLGATLSYITGSQIALQLISMIAAGWILYLLVMLLIREFPGRELEAIVYIVLFLGCAPFFFRYSITVMSDMMALAFACSCFYLIYLFVQCKHDSAIYFIPFIAAMGIFTRFAMLPLLIPVLILTIRYQILKFRVVPFLLSWMFAIIPLLLHFYFKGADAGDAFRHEWITGWSLMNFFRNSFDTIDGHSEYLLPNIIYVFSFLVHPGYIFPGILFLIILIFKKSKPLLLWPVMVLSMACYLFFLAGMPTRNDRFLVVMLPFYLVICFPAFLSILAYFHEKKKLLRLIVGGIFLIQVSLTTRAFLPLYNLNKTERHVAERAKEYHPVLLYTFGMEGALRSYGYAGSITNLWPQKLDTISAGALLLFNRKANEKQWMNRSVMINFNLLKDSAEAKLIEDAGDGWEFYETKKAYPASRTGLSL